MKTILHFTTSVVGLVLAAMATNPNPALVKSPGETVNAKAGQPTKAIPAEAAASTLQSTYAPWSGYGSMTLTLLDDGILMMVVRIDGDPPSDSPERKEPLDTYVYFWKPDGLRLVGADGEYFLDRSGSALKARNLLPSQVSLIEFGRPSTEQADSPKNEIILELRGDMSFDWIASANYGHLRVMDLARATAFEVGFTGTASAAPSGPAWRPWCCSLYLGALNHCSRCCPPLYWCHPRVGDDGAAVCECLPRSGGGGWIDLLPDDSGAWLGSSPPAEEDSSLDGQTTEDTPVGERPGLRG